MIWHGLYNVCTLSESTIHMFFLETKHNILLDGLLLFFESYYFGYFEQILRLQALSILHRVSKKKVYTFNELHV